MNFISPSSTLTSPQFLLINKLNKFKTNSFNDHENDFSSRYSPYSQSNSSLKSLTPRDRVVQTQPPRDRVLTTPPRDRVLTTPPRDRVLTTQPPLDRLIYTQPTRDRIPTAQASIQVQTQNENGIQVQINSLEVRVNEQSVELNNLKTVQAYPKEYVS